jgi:hypothetical protein
MTRELAQKVLREPVMIVTNDFDGRDYSGLLPGVLEKNGYFYAAQNIGDNHIIPHVANPSDLPAVKALIGQKVEIASDSGRILNIIDTQNRPKRLERNRG